MLREKLEIQAVSGTIVMTIIGYVSGTRESLNPEGISDMYASVHVVIGETKESYRSLKNSAVGAPRLSFRG